MKANKEQTTATKISFETKLFKIGEWTLLKLPKSASLKLSSRGMVMVEGTINGFRFQTTLEPDGMGSHWFRVNKKMSKAIGVDAGDSVKVVIEQTKEWVEPEVPEDLKKALSAVPHAQGVWMDITPFARWEWLRWIGSTKSLETRKVRIEKTCSKLNADKRRPCCFNSNQCTVPYVSNNGVLLEPV